MAHIVTQPGMVHFLREIGLHLKVSLNMNHPSSFSFCFEYPTQTRAQDSDFVAQYSFAALCQRLPSL